MTVRAGTAAMPAAVMRGPRQVALESVPRPVPGPGEVLVRVRACSICGSDLHYWHEGRIGAVVVAGEFTPGHEFAGEVAGGSGEPHGLPDGTLVAVDPAQPCGQCYWCREGNPHLCPKMTFVGAPPTPGGMAEYVAVPAHTVHPVPQDFTPAQAALLEPLGVAIHALDLARLRPGTNLAVLGAGPIGLYVLMLAQISGAAQVSVIEPLAYRRDKALTLGAAAAYPDVGAFLAAVQDTPTRGADVVVEATTSPQGPRQAARAARIGGKVILVGIPGGDEFSLTASEVRRKGLTLKFSRRMGDIYPRAVRLVQRGLIDVEAPVTHTWPLARVGEAFSMLADYRQDAIKVVLEP